MEGNVITSTQASWTQHHPPPVWAHDDSSYSGMYRLEHKLQDYDRWRKYHEYSVPSPGVQLHTPPRAIYEGTLEIEKKQSNRNILLLL